MDDKWIAAIWGMVLSACAACIIVATVTYNGLRAEREKHIAQLIAQGGHATLVSCALNTDCPAPAVMAIVAEIERGRRP